MATQESKLRVSLIDDVSRRAKLIGGALGMMERQGSPLGGLIGKVAAFGGAYLGVNTAIEDGFKPAADMQAAMTEIGIKADLSQSALSQLQERLKALAPQTNQTTQALTEGVDTMLTMGLAANDASAAIPAIGKAATATGAAIADLSGASVSAIQNLKVAPGLVAQMLDGMAAAGNAGAFELKDMAQYFPQLTASAQTLGMEGVPAINDIAAALQIARRGAGDASTAANNLSDFMGKIMTPQTIKNFKKFGVDVTKELQKAHKKGVSPIEHFIKLIDEKTKGGQGDLLTQIFGDKQTLDFIRPMIAGFNDYLRIRDQADRANGTVAEAFSRRMQDANQKIKAAQIGLSNLGMSIGANFLGPVGEGAQYIADILNTLDERATIFGKLQTGAQGFLNGLGIGDGDLTSVAKEVEAFFFGVQDAGKAADEYGRIFHRFQEWGQDIRSFSDAIRESPLGTFIGNISGMGLDLLLAAGGISLVATAVKALGKAMLLVTGASAAIGLIKAITKATNLSDALPDVGGGNKRKGGNPRTKGGPSFGLTDMFGLWNAYNLVAAIPNNPADLQKFMADNKAHADELNSWLDDRITTPSEYVKSFFAKRASRDPHPNLGADVGTVLGLDDARRSAGLGLPGTTDTLPGKRADDAISLTAESIAAISRPSGVQDVKVTNPVRPNVTQSFTFNINGATDPKAVADAVQQQLGKAAKSAVEESFGGGGGF